MGRLINLELNKAIVNRWFIFSLLIASSLALASALIEADGALAWSALKDGGSQEYLVMTTQGAYGAWMLLGADVAREAFFFLCPLLAIMPYAWSLRSEIVSGHIGQLYTRCPRCSYFMAKTLATFCTGFLIISIPLLINFLALSCLLPSYTPEAFDNLYLGINPGDAFARLFYSRPFLYVVANVVTDGFLCGGWAICVLAISTLVDNRVILLAGSYLFSIAMHFLSKVIFPAAGVTAFRFSLIDLTQGPGDVGRDPRALVVVLLAQIAFGIIVLYAQKERDAL